MTDTMTGVRSAGSAHEHRLRARGLTVGYDRVEVIAGLDPLSRALLLLYLDDRSHREIAEILGIGESNVGTKINRLKQRIRARLA